jgi:lactonase
MKKILLIGGLLITVLIASLLPRLASTQPEKSIVPLPPDLKGLLTIEAEPWLQIGESPALFLEGPAFDREGNLYISSLLESRVLEITPEKKVTTILEQKGLLPNGIAFHKDGRMFIACSGGKLISLNPDGTNLTYITARYQGKPVFPNDLVFDSKGNLYVTDFIGHVGNPAGGVYRFSADFTKVDPVVEGLALANGIALTPSGKEFWVVETGRSEVVFVQLMDDGITIRPPAGCSVPYRFTGGGCDSMTVDAAGNAYICINGQGRIVVLNPRGIPIANVLIPDRDEGMHLGVTNVKFKPGTDEAYATVSGKGGGWVYKFKGLTKSITLFSDQQ